LFLTCPSRPLPALINGDLHPRQLDSADIEGRDRVEIAALPTSDKQRELAIEYIIGRLSLEQGVTAAKRGKVTTVA
jgi:putative Mg2+ transporter-C (MgtC) family protein